WHPHVADDAGNLVEAGAGEERGTVRENAGPVALHLEQVGERLAHRPIVIHDGNHLILQQQNRSRLRGIGRRKPLSPVSARGITIPWSRLPPSGPPAARPRRG